ncbi:MAG: energy transducer TonB [Gemmatimonadaceae bacterium]|nr:energy transducer TonB [Gemmatimonadaceae bacterium]
MFDQLLETKAAKQKKSGGTVISIVLHTILVAGAIYATNKTAEALEKPKEEKVVLTETKKEPEPEKPKEQPKQQQVVAQVAPPKGFQVRVLRSEIPDVIPDVDLSKKATDEADFSGKGVQGGIAKGVEGGTGPVISDQPYFDFQVEKAAAAIPGSGNPAYPEMLKSSGVEGEALVQFIVDTTGRAELGSFKVLRASHDAFGQAVRSALPRMRFLPAEIGGRKVRMLVQQPFAFALNR